MILAQEARKRSKVNHWKIIDDAIDDAVNNGDNHVSIIGEISDDEKLSLQNKGYHIERISVGFYTETMISWEA